jgi:hypothetical protein
MGQNYEKNCIYQKKAVTLRVILLTKIKSNINYEKNHPFSN